MLLLTIHYWVFNFEQLILSTKTKNMLDNRTIQFWIVKSPTQKIMPPDYKPKSNTSCAPNPKKLPQNIEYPSPIITQKIIHKTSKKLRAKNLIRNRSKAKNKTKKCVIYIHSVEEICVLNFFWVIFLLGVNVMRKQKQKTTIPRGLQQPKIPILLMETSMDLFWDMDHYELLFLSSMIFILLLYFQG